MEIWESSSEAEVEAILLGGGSGEFESEITYTAEFRIK